MTATGPQDFPGRPDSARHDLERDGAERDETKRPGVGRNDGHSPAAPDQFATSDHTVSPGDAREDPDDLAEARARGELTLLYQPEFDLRRGTFVGVEALLRWRHPTRGLLGPRDFADALVAPDVAVAVGRWVLAEATRQGARWHDRGHRFAVALNVSRGQVTSPTFVDDVASALRAHALAPAALTLELATTTLENLDDPRRAALLALGVRLGVDDVVPGVTNVDDLIARGVGVVKLARGAVSDRSRDAALAAMLATLATRDVRVVAAGVESPVTARRLEGATDLAVEGQGFLYARPLPASAIDELLADFAIFSGEPL
ncbi:MAG: EAL domain-containing protein [Acidimicrobiales bacterium]